MVANPVGNGPRERKAVEAKLVILSGSHKGQAVPIPCAKFFIGRSEDYQLRPQSDLVSRHHCVILVEEGLVAVRDFDSRNGTFLNGERIKGECELKNGDRLKVGPLEFEVQLAVPVGGKRKPKVKSIQEAAARSVEKAQPSPDDEMDVSDWIDNGSATTDQSAAQTTRMAVGADSDTREVAASAQEEPKKKEGEEVKIVGQFARTKKPTTECSRDAAADTLRKFFGRR